jgi:hypothetical protein
MGMVISHDSVEAQIVPGGGRGQGLIDADLVSGTMCLFDRVVLDPGSHLQLQPTDVGIATLGNRPAIHTTGVGGIGPSGYG